MLHRLDHLDIIGTGFTVLDRLYADGDLASEALGGSCGNVLVSLAMLRRHVAPLLALGGDDTGARLVQEFQLAGADIRFISCHENRRSPVLRQELDTSSGHHSFSFTCRETEQEFPRYQPIGRDDVESATAALSRCAIFYTDRLSPSILEAMACAHAAGALVYFEPSDVDCDLFEDALELTTILKYSSDRLGPELDERVAASGAIAIVTYGAEGLEVRHGFERLWSEAVPASQVTDTCGSGDMVSIGLIDWLLTHPVRPRHDLTIHDLMIGVTAGQRLAAENCAFAGARGVFINRGVSYVRGVLGSVPFDI